MRSYNGMATRNHGRTKRKFAANRQSKSGEKSLQEIDTPYLSDHVFDHNSTTPRCIFNGTGSHVANKDSVFPPSGILDAHHPLSTNIESVAESHLQHNNSVTDVAGDSQVTGLLSVTNRVPVYGVVYPATSARKVRSSSEPATASTGSEAASPIFAPDKFQRFIIHPESAIKSTIRTRRRDLDDHNNETSRQISAEKLGQQSLATPTCAQAYYDSTTASFTRCRVVSKEMEELYKESDTILILSSIMERKVKYHEQTADFKDGDTLVTKIVKGIDAIMKPPTDLRDHFDLSKINTVKNKLKKEQAGLESLQTISLWNETFRYDYAMKFAQAKIRSFRVQNPSSVINPRQAEVDAVKELVDVVSKGRSNENYRKYERFWKFLYDLRIEGTVNETEDDSTARMVKEGIAHILLFRTGTFNRRFFNKTKNSLQRVRKWNQIYYPYMKEVEMRVLAGWHNDFAYEIDLHQSTVRKALKTAQIDWVNGTQDLNRDEQQLCLADLPRMSALEELSVQSTKDVLRDGIECESERNKAIFICLIPYEGPQNNKRRVDGSPASRVLVAPCPVVPISPGDFLGVMSGQLRYTPERGRSNKAIQGPYPKLWLDFSKITGKLSCMKASALSNELNVTLTWKRYNSESAADWRVEVVATKEIWPFEELVRGAT